MKISVSALILLLVLGGCDTPSPRFWDVEPNEFKSEELTADIYIDGDQAQVLRLSTTLPWRSEQLTEAMTNALIFVSGCNDVEIVVNQENTTIDYQLNC